MRHSTSRRDMLEALCSRVGNQGHRTYANDDSPHHQVVSGNDRGGVDVDTGNGGGDKSCKSTARRARLSYGEVNTSMPTPLSLSLKTDQDGNTEELETR